MKNHKILLSIFAIALGVISVKVMADVELQNFRVNLPAFQSTYKSDSYRKKYVSNQNYKCIGNMSNHDGTKHPVLVNLIRVSDNYSSGFKTIDIGDEYGFNRDEFKETGYYRIELKNQAWSIYTYFTNGIWQYSM